MADDFVGPVYTPPALYSIGNYSGPGEGGWDPGPENIINAMKSGNARMVDVYRVDVVRDGYWDSDYYDKPVNDRYGSPAEKSTQLLMNGKLYLPSNDWGMIPSWQPTGKYDEEGNPIISNTTGAYQIRSRSGGGSNVFNNAIVSFDPSTGYATGYNPNVYQTGSDNGGFFGSTPIGGALNDLVSMVKENPVLPIVINAVVPGAGAVIQAVNAIDQGNTAAAIAALSNIPGASDIASPEVVDAIKTATQTATLVNALSTGNTLAAINSVAALTGSKGTEIGDTGVTVGDALKLANIANAIDSGNIKGVINGIQSLGTSSGVKEDATVVPANDAADLLDNVMGTEAQPTQPTEETAVAEALDPNTVEGARQIAQDEGWASEAEKNFANIVYGVTTPEEYRAIVGETAATEGPSPSSPEVADQIAQAEGWQSEAEKNFASIVYGVTTPDEYHAIVGETSPTDGSVDLQPSEPAPSGEDLVPAVHTGELPADVVQQLQGAGLEEQKQEPVVPAGPTQAELQNQETIKAAQEAIDKQTADAEEAARQQQLQYEAQQRDAEIQAGITADRERQTQEEKDYVAAELARTQAESQQQLEAIQKQEQDAQAAGWKDAGEQSDAATWGFSNPQEYRDYMAQANGWANADEQAAAQQQGYSAPYSYHEAMDQAAGWRSSDEKLAAAGMGMYTPAEYNAWLNPEQPPEDVYTPTTDIAPTETQPSVSAPVEEPSIDQLPVDDGTTPGIQEIIDQYIQQPEVVQQQTAEEPATTAQEPSAVDEVKNAPEVPTEVPITEEATSTVAQETPVETAPVTEEVLPVEEKTQDQMTPEDWAALYATPTTNPETGETIVGADTSEYAPQDLGIEQDMLNEYQQNLIDQENAGQPPSQWQSNGDGTHTMVADDGSTLTVDDTGQIVDYTEAPAGNLPGETPVVTPPTSGQTTAGGTTTGGAPATRGGTPAGGTPSLPATPAPTTQKSNFDLAALLSILGAASMQQPQQPQVQEPRGEMKEFDFEAPLDVNFFSPTKKNVAGQNQQQTTKIATGGYIEDLLHILRG